MKFQISSKRRLGVKPGKKKQGTMEGDRGHSPLASEVALGCKEEHQAGQRTR